MYLHEKPVDARDTKAAASPPDHLIFVNRFLLHKSVDTHCATRTHLLIQTTWRRGEASRSRCFSSFCLILWKRWKSLQHTLQQTLQQTLQHTATHCDTLQHTATHCKTLTRCFSSFCLILWKRWKSLHQQRWHPAKPYKKHPKEPYIYGALSARETC